VGGRRDRTQAGLLLTGQVLVVWMARSGVDLPTASAFAAVGLPYTFKWAWAPLFDRFAWPWLGRRRGWIVVLELALAAAILALAEVGLAADVELVAGVAVALAAVPRERVAGVAESGEVP